MIDALNVAQTGLRAAKTTVENVMNNIANENTPGYKRRTVDLQELSHTDSRVVGRGVQVGSVTRATSSYMFNNLINEGTKESYLQELSGMLGGVESLYKETDLSGFSADLNRYFQSVENLRSNPDSEVFRNDLKSQGATIVDALTRLYDGLEEQQNMARESLGDDVDTVNDILKDIGSINEQLGQQYDASNDLLDRRDQLESELSQYIDIEVNRSGDDYELKVGGVTAVRHSTNIRELVINEEKVAQVDRYIQNDGITSSLLPDVDSLDGVPYDMNFDDGDVVTFKLDNESSVSVTFGETITDSKGNAVDINADGVVDSLDTVDSKNLVRALVYKINNSTDMLSKVDAYNGNYAIDENGEKVTYDDADHFLMIESKIPGTEGKFESRISFSEIPDPDPVEATPLVGSPTIASITDGTIKNEGSDLTHTIALSEPSTVDETYSFTIYDDTTNGTATDGALDYTTSGAVFTNGVTWADATYTDIIVPAGVTEFSVSIPTVIDAPLTDGDEDYLIEVGTAQAKGIIKDQGESAVISSISAESETEGTALVHTIDLSGPVTTSGAVGLDYEFTISHITTEETDDIDTTNVVFSNGVTLMGTTLHIPDGVTSFTATIDTQLDDFHEIDEEYEISINDFNRVTTAKGTIIDDDTAQQIVMYKDEGQSTKAEDILEVTVYDNAIPITSGSMKSQIDNLNSEAPGNLIQGYKDRLDEFARALSDITDQYMRTADGSDYIYGESAIDDLSNADSTLMGEAVFNLGLFSGSDVRTLQFNTSAVNDLNQNDLDYLAKMQFKDDIYFNGKPQGSGVLKVDSQGNEILSFEDSDKTSFSDFFQAARVGIATDKENTDFLKETQMTVKQSIQSAYDQITKVDKDEEMINLIKFQAAYTANAKIVTVVDEMLNTLLGMR